MRRAVAGHVLGVEPGTRLPIKSSPNTRAISAASKAPAFCRQVRVNSALRFETSSPSADSTPGAGGTTIGRHAEQARQRAAVQRPGAAEGQQREVARVVAALDRDHADGAHHVVVDDGEDAARGRLDAHAQRLGDLLGDGRARAASASSAKPPPSR